MRPIIVILISAGTAFIIGCGGALGVALIATHGAALNKESILAAVAAGLVLAAKDVRTLLKLPPINGAPGSSGNTGFLSKTTNEN